MVLCYGGDKAHLFRADGGVAGMAKVPCASLSAGASILGWASADAATSGLDALVVSAGNDFLLNYQRIETLGNSAAALYRNGECCCFQLIHRENI